MVSLYVFGITSSIGQDSRYMINTIELRRSTGPFINKLWRDNATWQLVSRIFNNNRNKGQWDPLWIARSTQDDLTYERVAIA